MTEDIRIKIEVKLLHKTLPYFAKKKALLDGIWSLTSGTGYLFCVQNKFVHKTKLKYNFTSIHSLGKIIWNDNFVHICKTVHICFLQSCLPLIDQY
jgi:hypothetical protein